MYIQVKIEKELYLKLLKGSKFTGIEITKFINEALEEWNETFGQALQPAEPSEKSTVERKATGTPEELDSETKANLVFGECVGGGGDYCKCRACDPPEDEFAIICSDIPFKDQLETVRLLRSRKQFSPAVVVSDSIN